MNETNGKPSTHNDNIINHNNNNLIRLETGGFKTTFHTLNAFFLPLLYLKCHQRGKSNSYECLSSGRTVHYMYYMMSSRSIVELLNHIIFFLIGQSFLLAVLRFANNNKKK